MISNFASNVNIHSLCEFLTATSNVVSITLTNIFFLSRATTTPAPILYHFRTTPLGNSEINGDGLGHEGNETLFNFDPTLPSSTVISIKNHDTQGSFAAVYAPNSTKQDRINTLIKGNFGIQNSTSIAKLSLIGNTAATTIVTQSVNTPINANVLWVIDSIIERYLLQDECTFDNTTNTINTAFNHGMSDNDRVPLKDYPGSILPAELNETTNYFVVNSNVADFQISLTEGGAVVNFDDPGSGTLHYRHNTGVTQLAELIYIGNETIKQREDGWCTLASTLGTKIDVRATVMKIDTSHTITEAQIGSPITVNSTETGASDISNVSEISTGEGRVIYVRNDIDTTNIIPSDITIGYNDVS